jgi:hypothetical protein
MSAGRPAQALSLQWFVRARKRPSCYQMTWHMSRPQVPHAGSAWAQPTTCAIAPLSRACVCALGLDKSSFVPPSQLVQAVAEMTPLSHAPCDECGGTCHAFFALAMCWHSPCAGTRHVLALALCWHSPCAGTRHLLALALCWHSPCAGALYVAVVTSRVRRCSLTCQEITCLRHTSRCLSRTPPCDESDGTCIASCGALAIN